MAKSSTQSNRQPDRRRLGGIKRTISALAGTAAIALTLLAAPAIADPFRPSNPRNIDDQTEEAFNTMFRNGNYREAEALLQSAGAADPMAHAMRAAIAYLNEDWSMLQTQTRSTLAAAEQLLQTDPLRGHLYTAVGHFMEGAHVLSTEGTVRATPIVLSKLRLVFDNFSQAESIDPTDPELNLIKGYVDLMLAVNLPFSNPEQAIARLQDHASPRYLVDRGLAIAYRDLDRYDDALASVDAALQETPSNPDLYYLKAQILRLQGDYQESVRYFNQALRQSAQLPENLVEQIAWEKCRTEDDLSGRSRDCHRVVERRGSVAAEADES